MPCPPATAAPRRPLAHALLLATFLFLSGCLSTRPDLHEPEVARFEPHNVYLAAENLSQIQRVTVLPIHYKPQDHLMGSGIEETVYQELLKTLRFETRQLERHTLQELSGAESFASNGHIPANLIPEIALITGADAVLFLDLTAYDPYQPMRIGWRAKLVDVKTQSIIWAFDHLYDAGHPVIAQSARLYARESSRNPYPLNRTTGILQSPQHFARYTAQNMFSTLPPSSPQQAAETAQAP